MFRANDCEMEKTFGEVLVCLSPDASGERGNEFSCTGIQFLKGGNLALFTLK